MMHASHFWCRVLGERREGVATATKTLPPLEDDGDLLALPQLYHRGKKPLRHLLYVKKYVDLDKYIVDFRKRKIIGYAKLPAAKRVELFGSTIVPIHVPLARWESADQYEERFVQWLSKKGLTLKTNKNEDLERFYRIKFANLNATGEEAFVPPSPAAKRERSVSDEPLPPSKKFSAGGSHRTSSSEAVKKGKEATPVEELEPNECCVKFPAEEA